MNGHLNSSAPAPQPSGPASRSISDLIFVVDDDPGFLKAISRLLRKQGFEVATFLSAEDFQQRAETAEPGCLILDVNLGGISGIELFSELSKSGTNIPVVFVTANDSDSNRRAAAAAGCVAYLEKPFALKSLMEAVGEALGQDRRSFD